MQEYLNSMSDFPEVPCEEAFQQKTFPTSAEVGLDAWDTMMELESIPVRIAFINQLHSMVCGDVKASSARVRVATYTMWGGDIWGLRRTMLPYIQWGIHIGICRFFFLYPGKDEQVVEYFKQIPSVRVYFVIPPFENGPILESWQRYLAARMTPKTVRTWTNHTHMQVFGSNLATIDARRDGYQWIMHIDSDELILPATSLHDELLALPRWAASMLVNNIEAQAEAVDIVNKYEQATLFRMHTNLRPPCGVSSSWRLRIGERNVFWMMYVNGKSMVRLDGPLTQPHGLHRFKSANFTNHSEWADPVFNPMGKFKELYSNNTVVLHYTYLNWHDLMSKASRRCSREYYDAAMAENMTALKECFIMKFDMWSYKASLLGEEESKRFWMANALLSDGSYNKVGETCRVWQNLRWVKDKMVQSGVFRRIGEVRETLRAHEVSIRLLAGALGVPLPKLGETPKAKAAAHMAGVVRRSA